MRFIIYNNGVKINTIVSDEKFCKKYCNANQYTYQIVDDDHENQTKTAILSREDEIDAILVDQEYRLTLLELGVNE